MPMEPDALANELVSAVELLDETFAARSIQEAFLGGLATMLRGRPRFTQDVDLLLDVPQRALPGLLDDLPSMNRSPSTAPATLWPGAESQKVSCRSMVW